MNFTDFLERFSRAAPEQRAGYIAVMAALAAAVSLAERLIPLPLPGVKPGLANVVALILVAAGFWRAALSVTLLRTAAAAAVTGSLFTPGHLLALGGGCAAVLVMAAVARCRLLRCSLYGVSAAGAWAHTAVQLLIAGLLLVPLQTAVSLGRLLLPLAVGTGLVTAFAASILMGRSPGRRIFQKDRQ